MVKRCHFRTNISCTISVDCKCKKTQSIQTAIDGVITEVLVHEGKEVKRARIVLLNKQQKSRHLK